MLTSTFTLVFAALSATVSASSQAAPDCVTKCWTNSQYVSLACAGNTKCLCENSDFQNAVYQCLYSQCPTSKFGIALHHALGYCAVHDIAPASQTVSSQAMAATTPAPAPPLLRNEGLKRRVANLLHQSNSVTHTRHTHSVSATAHMAYATNRAMFDSYGRPINAASEVSLDHHGNPALLHGEAMVDALVEPQAPRNAMYRLANDRLHKPHSKKDEPSKDL